MNNYWIYAGVFLDDSSKAKMKEMFKLPDGWKEYFDHMTIVFNDGSEYAQIIKNFCEKNEGKEVCLKVVGQGLSNNAYAVEVVLPPGIPCANKIPHITLGCSPIGKPVDSNSIENWHNIDNPFYVYGTVLIRYKG